MAISKITGKNYTRVQGITTWDDNVRFKQALKLSQMFGFELCQQDTEQNLINSVEKLRHMYEDEKLTNSQFVEMFNWQNKFFTSFLETLGIKRRTKSEALKNWCRIQGKIISEPKDQYWAECQFSFDVYNFPNIPGYELLKNHKWYHPVKNKHGLQRDHMLSISFGWENNIDARLISHPANCHIMLAYDNITKNNNNSITFEQLLLRISSNQWNAPEQQYEKSLYKRTRNPLTEQAKDNLRQKNTKMYHYTNGKINKRFSESDVIPDGFYRGLIKDGILAKGQNVDWKLVQKDIDIGLSKKDICNRYNIDTNILRWAKRTNRVKYYFGN